MSLCDEIERYLLGQLLDEERAMLSRHDLAARFSCAPSQINYVLQTRFTVDRGFSVEGRRGGGGYILVRRLKDDALLLDELEFPNGISHRRVCQIAERLMEEGAISTREARLIIAATADGALLDGEGTPDLARAQIFRSLVIEILKEDF